MIQPDRRQLLSKYALGRHRIGGNRNACDLPKRLEETEAGIPGDAGHGRGKVVPRPEDATQKRRVLELANRDLEPRGRQSRLQHLLQRSFSTADGQELEAQRRAAPQRGHEPQIEVELMNGRRLRTFKRGGCTFAGADGDEPFDFIDPPLAHIPNAVTRLDPLCEEPVAPRTGGAW